MAPRTLRLVRPLLKTKDLGPLFGVQRRTIRNWVARGVLPAIKVGRELLFRESDVRRLLKPRRPETLPLPFDTEKPEPGQAA